MNKPHTPLPQAAGEHGHPESGIGETLTTALRDGRLLAAYQPIIDLKTGAVVAEEALARIRSPNGSIIPASAFLDIARNMALTHLLDQTIMLQAFARARQAAHPGRLYFLNISTLLLQQPEMLKALLNVAAQSENVMGKSYVIQLTGHELLNHPQETQRLLAPLLDFGMRLALDDFGSGGSSYKYLASLPFAFLKVEGSLVRRIAEPRVRIIVQGIQEIATGLGITTLAEHIESEEIADKVRALGIPWGQGRYFGKPVLPISQHI